MPTSGHSLITLSLILAACGPGAPAPHRLTSAGASPAVWGVLELPTAPGPHPALVLLPGSGGWRPGYARFARTFADSGFVALAIDYYAETGRGGPLDNGDQLWHTWQATVRSAVTFLHALPEVADKPIGLVGYSRGAFLAISMAATAPGVQAVVDFYGSGSDDDPPAAAIPAFPPVLILHGEADSIVSVRLAHRLYDRMRAHGGQVEMHLYPGAGHVFNAPWASTYSSHDAADAWARSVGFLRRQLGGTP